MKDSLKIAIAGATGYTGIQLIKIHSLPRHPLSLPATNRPQRDMA